MDSKKKKELELWAARIRKTALQTIRDAGSGHIGGSFSICDIMSVLYFDQMKVDPADPEKKDRDRLGQFSVLSFAFASYFPPLQGINLLFFTLFILLPSFFLNPLLVYAHYTIFSLFCALFSSSKNDTFRHFFEKVSFL